MHAYVNTYINVLGKDQKEMQLTTVTTTLSKNRGQGAEESKYMVRGGSSVLFTHVTAGISCDNLLPYSMHIYASIKLGNRMPTI